MKFLDDGADREIDISMLMDVRKNSYVEVFSNIALNILTRSEALWKKKLWIELRERSGQTNL